MNKAILAGRLTRDPEVGYTPDQTAIARYTLAVDRGGREGTDYINCVAFGKTGVFAERYLKQGIKIMVFGHIQTGSYTNKDGKKVYTTDVIVEEHEFMESSHRSSGTVPVIPEEFMSTEGYDDMPFR
jgi:single-strand DNA-binding protein